MVASLNNSSDCVAQSLKLCESRPKRAIAWTMMELAWLPIKVTARSNAVASFVALVECNSMAYSLIVAASFNDSGMLNAFAFDSCLLRKLMITASLDFWAEPFCFSTIELLASLWISAKPGRPHTVRKKPQYSAFCADSCNF